MKSCDHDEIEQIKKKAVPNGVSISNWKNNANTNVFYYIKLRNRLPLHIVLLEKFVASNLTILMACYFGRKFHTPL